MRTANNNFTVESLVAKYRNYVKEHCPKICEECGLVPVLPDGNADEQLLVTLYNSVAGKKADHQIISALAKYAEKYKQAALEEEEYAYLCENFKEFVSYEFAHRSEWAGGFIVGGSVPSQFLEIIREMATPENGQTVFVADAGWGDVAMLFPDCVVKGFTGYCGSTIMYDEVWALGQIRLYAAGIKSEIVPGIFDESKEKYMYTLPDEDSADVVIYGTTWDSECEDIHQLYRLLRPNGTMFLFSDKKRMAGDGEEKSLREQLVCEKAIHLLGSFEGDFIGMATDIILAHIRKTVNETVEIVNGKRGTTKVVKAEELDSNILWPSYYLASRPSDGKPLSSIVEISSNERLAKFVKGEGYVLSEEAKDMLLVLPNALGESYKDANLWHKSFSNVSDPAFKKEDWVRFRVTKEPCVLLNGSIEKLLVGYTTNVPSKGFAYMAGCCLLPKEGVDVRYVAALLFEPSVKEQILTICDGNVKEQTLSLVLDKIIVPNHDDKERLNLLVEANEQALMALRDEKEKTFDEKLLAMKADYINEVRMRKHDIRPYLRQLASTERLMLYYLENANSLDELKRLLKDQLNYAHGAMSSISSLVDHLSDEEKFGKAEVMNLDKFLTDLEVNHNDDEGFLIEYDSDKDSLKKAGFLIETLLDEWELSKQEDFTKFIKEHSHNTLPLFVKIAPIDLQRLVDNIVENARKHGFTDNARSDYYIGVDLSVNTERNMFQIDFSNNGNPLPEGMTKERFGINGEKAGKTAGTGSGGYIIKSIVNHYDGDFDVFTNNGITTIRIFLPINERV